MKSYPTPLVIITDKLNSYKKPIKYMYKSSDHRSHKGLNNRAENTHSCIRHKEKSMIKLKINKDLNSCYHLWVLRNVYVGIKIQLKND